MINSQPINLSLSLDLKAKSRALARALYVNLRIPSHVIAEVFRAYDIPISTKTIIKVAGREKVRGFDPWHNRQTYGWKKYFGKIYRSWARTLGGKITPALRSIMEAFWAWFAYSRLYGEFDLDAVLRGEKPP